MELQIPHIDVIHQRFVGDFSGRYKDEESSSSYFSSLWVCLAPPLTMARLSFGYQPETETYSTFLTLVGETAEIYDGLSGIIARNVSESKGMPEWRAVRENGLGYFLREGHNFIALAADSSSPEEAGDIRVISLGSFGAEPIRLDGDVIEFGRTVDVYRRVSNMVLLSIYNSSKEGKENLKKIGDLPLFLDCII